MTTSREARRRHLAMLDARQKQHEAVHRMEAIARELGIEDETPSIAHGGTIRGLVGRAISKDMLERREGAEAQAGLDTHYLFKPVKE